MLPKQIVQKWVEAFNKADVVTLSKLYHTNAINHQVANASVEGREASRKMFEQKFSQADMVCT